MTRTFFTCLRVTGVALLVAIQQVALAQQCYYPNGNEAPEKACSSADGSACCPDKWECLDNGLCHYEPDNLYGRYSCTDKDWKAEGCPSNLCTYDMTAFGGEAITQCSDHDNQWCCNADATHVNCCKESPEPRPFFKLQDGKAYATIGGSTASDAPNLASITGSATGSGSDDSKPSSTSPPSSSRSAASATKDSESSSAESSSSKTPVTSVQTSVASGSAGVSTVIQTVVTTPSAASSTSGPSASEPGHKSKTPIIVGCAVGIPLAIAFIGILAWLLRKKRQQKRYSGTPDPYTNGALTPEFAGGAKLHKNSATVYKNETVPPMAELSGQPVGPGRPVSMIPNKAELESGSGFAPGATPHAPHLVGVGGGNGNGAGYGHTPQSSWGSAPPGYSPGMNQNAWMPAGAQPSGQTHLGTGAVQNSMQGAPTQPSTDGVRYIPYRPPPGHGAALQNVPEAAEMSAVRTPPAVAEMGPGRSPPAE